MTASVQDEAALARQARLIDAIVRAPDDETHAFLVELLYTERRLYAQEYAEWPVAPAFRMLLPSPERAQALQEAFPRCRQCGADFSNPLNVRWRRRGVRASRACRRCEARYAMRRPSRRKLAA